MATEQKHHNGLEYSSLNPTKQHKREQIKSGMDDFCTFSWCGINAWNYGAFITNKNDLKFYNGPQFSNTYAQPQYNTSALLEGVTFKVQQIKFKIGVYWISDKEYREFINWLNPYSIGTLIFDFDTKWGYRVKLANREDSTRYCIGYEWEDGESKRRYYTEMTLTFEVQGQPCAIATQSYEYKNIENIVNNEQNVGYDCTLNQYSIQTPSDLPMPFKATFSFTYTTNNVNTNPISFWIKYQGQETELFELQWTKDFIADAKTWNPSDQQIQTIWLEYDSESGIIYQKYGDGQYRLLNLWSSADNGYKVLDAIKVRKFLIPGRFNNPTISMEDIHFEIDNINNSDNPIDIQMYGRTNVI